MPCEKTKSTIQHFHTLRVFTVYRRYKYYTEPPSNYQPGRPALTWCQSDLCRAMQAKAATIQQLPSSPCTRSWQLIPSTLRQGLSTNSWRIQGHKRILNHCEKITRTEILTASVHHFAENNSECGRTA